MVYGYIEQFHIRITLLFAIIYIGDYSVGLRGWLTGKPSRAQGSYRGPGTTDSIIEKEYLRYKINCLVQGKSRVPNLYAPRETQSEKQSRVSGTLKVAPYCFLKSGGKVTFNLKKVPWIFRKRMKLKLCIE